MWYINFYKAVFSGISMGDVFLFSGSKANLEDMTGEKLVAMKDEDGNLKKVSVSGGGCCFFGEWWGEGCVGE